MSQLHNFEAELKVLYSICESTSDKERRLTLSEISKEHFYDPISKTLYARLKILLNELNDIPDWFTLTSDPIIPTDYLSEINNRNISCANTKKEFKNILSILDDYRKIRVLCFSSQEILTKLRDKDYKNVDDLIIAGANNLIKARNKTGETFKSVRIGGDNPNFNESLTTHIFNKDIRRVIPTGWKAFDSINGGFTRNGVAIIAANTGGGKTTALVDLTYRWGLAGEKVGVIPLEMGEHEMHTRYLARLNKINSLRFTKQELTPQDEINIRMKENITSARMSAIGGEIDFRKPCKDYTIEELLTVLEPFNHNIIIIDYMALLAGLSGQDAHAKMEEASRFAANWAENSSQDRLVVLAAQLNANAELAKSKAMADAANHMLYWFRDKGVASKESETEILHIKQHKARNCRMFDFYMKANFGEMSFTDLTDQELTDYLLNGDSFNSSGHEGNKPQKYIKLLNTTDEPENPIEISV